MYDAFLMTMHGDAANAMARAKVLVREWLSRWGVPDIITSDYGSQFVSDLRLEDCSLMDIARDPTTSYNGKIERSSAVIGVVTATETHPSDLLQPFVILQEECEILEGNVYVTVPALLPVLLNRHPTARVGVLVDLLTQSASQLSHIRWNTHV